LSRQLTVAAGFEPVADIFRAIHSDTSSGGSFAVTVDGRVMLDMWGGLRDDGTPWRDDTMCIIASGTKGICAVAVLMCVERGLVDLEAPISVIWPEFSKGGKGAISVGDALAHVAGIPGIERELSIEDISDPMRIAAIVAAQEPIVPIGMPSYHALTFGWIAGEIVRRADGRTIGRFVDEEISRPLGLDLYIGAPEEVISRISTTTRSADYQLSAFLPGSTPDPRLKFVYGLVPTSLLGTSQVFKIELPGGGGVTNAWSMARLYGALARGGEIDGVRLLQPDTIAVARRQRSEGHDPLSGRFLRFGVGFELNPNPSCLGGPANAFGHTGAGGSTHGAWPSLKTGFSYTMGEFRPESNDGRAKRLLVALEECLN
jgi:CubicO group peptidase (beta-lactamase class C family)